MRISAIERNPIEHLSHLYAASDDPWDHRASATEAVKFDATLAPLGPGRFHEALKIGCGSSTFAARLASASSIAPPAEIFRSNIVGHGYRTEQLSRRRKSYLAWRVHLHMGAARLSPLIDRAADEKLDGNAAIRLLGAPPTVMRDRFRIDRFD